jgi:hypothetical protein
LQRHSPHQFHPNQQGHILKILCIKTSIITLIDVLIQGISDL